MAAAQVVLEVLSEGGFLADVRTRAAYLDDALLKLQRQFQRRFLNVVDVVFYVV